MLYHVIPVPCHIPCDSMWGPPVMLEACWFIKPMKTIVIGIINHIVIEVIINQLIINQLSYHKSAINPMKSPISLWFFLWFFPSFFRDHWGTGKRKGTREARMPTKVLWMRRQRVLSLGIPRDFNRLGAEEKPDFSGYFLQIWLKDPWWSMVKLTFSVEKLVKTCDFCRAKSRVQPVDKWHRPTWG